MVFIFGTEDALHDGLIGTPVPNSEYWVSEHDGIPRHSAFVAMGSQHGELVGISCAFQGCQHGIPSSHFIVGDPGDDGGACDEDDGLDGLGEDNGEQSADDGVKGGESGDGDDGDVDINAENISENDPTGEE